MNISVPSMQDLLSAGVHFGHKPSRRHPKMGSFVFGARDGVDIIDLARSEEKLKEAAQAAYELGKSGGIMLIVGTKKQARGIVEELAKEAGTPFLSVHWIGGLLTNLEELKKNFVKLNALKEEQKKGELSRYTKKEQLLIGRKLTKFESVAGGVANLEKVPEAMFIVDAVSDKTAVKEGLKVGIRIFGICDTNADPNWFDYPVPANDDGIKSIKIICETIIKAYGKGKEEAKTVESGKSAESEKAKKVEEADGIKKDDMSLDEKVLEEAAVIEEEVEKKVLQESERKVT